MATLIPSDLSAGCHFLSGVIPIPSSLLAPHTRGRVRRQASFFPTAEINVARFRHLYRHHPGSGELGSGQKFSQTCLPEFQAPPIGLGPASRHAGQGMCMHCGTGLMKMSCGFHVSSGQLAPSGPVPELSHAQATTTSTWGRAQAGKTESARKILFCIMQWPVL